MKVSLEGQPSHGLIMSIGALAILLATSACAHTPLGPVPLALWTFQEPTGAPRLSVAPGVLVGRALLDGNTSHPIAQVHMPEGAQSPFGPFAASFDPVPSGSTNARRLFAPRDSVPELTAGIAGERAQVTIMAWVRIAQPPQSGGMIAGVWNEYLRARQYALFTDLGLPCAPAPAYHSGLVAHLSPVGGPTPGQRFCITAACDPAPLQENEWCVCACVCVCVWSMCVCGQCACRSR